MDSLWRANPWGYRLLFLLIAATVLFLKLLPLAIEAGNFPGPDIMLCLWIAWCMRRPDYLPVWLIAGVFLVEDLLLLRPPGLWTALVVMASEFLRSRTALTRELSFVIEWLLAASLMIGMLLLYRLAFMLALLPQPPFGFSVMQMVWSIALYPVVVGISRTLLDFSRPTNGETDHNGRRL